MFDDYFEVFLADTEEAKKIHFNIRYQVYCEEMGFEGKAKDETNSKLEIDEWDKQSVHFIVRVKRTNQWVGAVRVVTDKNNQLPLLSHYPKNQFHIAPPPEKVVEISRLCMLKEIRRRISDGSPPTGLNERENSSNSHLEFIRQQRKMQQSLIWGLIRAATLYCMHHSVKDWYFITTSSLAKIIKREGFNIQLCGESCEINGTRYPFKINNKEVLKNPFWSNGYKNHYKLYSRLELEECA